jgi:hypothetical protein
MKILFYSFQHSIHVHSMPESAVAKSLIAAGHEVVYLTCNSIYNDFCVNMAAFGLDLNSPNDKKNNVCKLCKSNRNKLTNLLGVQNYMIEDFVNQKIISKYFDELEIIDDEKLFKFEIDGHPIGKYASYEFVISNKLNTLQNLNKNLSNLYRSQIKNCIISYLCSKQALLEINPNKVICYNNFYSLNRTFVSVCDEVGLPHFNIHAGHNLANRLNTLMLYRSFKSYILLAHSEEWNERKKYQNNSIRIKKVSRHFNELFTAKNVFVYSTPTINRSSGELLNKFDIKNNQKVVLLLLTSGDERYAASLIDVMPNLKYNLLFSNQLELINSLIDYFKNRNEIKVIIRPHPREFPNKRESVYSMQGEQLKSILYNLPDNFKVNWPSDNISLYDLIKIIDICLPTTSTSGLELATLGMPIVTYSPDNIYAYPAEDLTFCAKSKIEYFNKIEYALKKGWGINFSIIAFRWWAFKFVDFDIDLTDIFNYTEYSSKNIFKRIINKIRRIFKLKPSHIYKIKLPKSSSNIVKVLENNYNIHLLDCSGNNFGDIEETNLVKTQLIKFHKQLGINKINFKKLNKNS